MKQQGLLRFSPLVIFAGSHVYSRAKGDNVEESFLSNNMKAERRPTGASKHQCSREKVAGF